MAVNKRASATKATARNTAAEATKKATGTSAVTKTARPAKATKTAKTAVAKTAGATKTAKAKATPKSSTPVATTSSARTTKAAPAKKRVAKAPPTVTASTARNLTVLEGESSWTSAELREVKEELEGDVARLEREIGLAEVGLAGLLEDTGDGNGDDEADAGAKTFEREQEISLANNSRDMLEQSLHALERISDGTYGVCESCGNPAGKLRLQAFPRATLCMTCKRKQERR